MREQSVGSIPCPSLQFKAASPGGGIRADMCRITWLVRRPARGEKGECSGERNP